MLILMTDITGTEILAGAVEGRKALNKLQDLTAKDRAYPEPVYLDFTGVQVATASFLREAVLAFRDVVRKKNKTNFYPIVANATPAVLDEFKVLMHWGEDSLVTCKILKDGTVSSAAVIGSLDEKQQYTFDLVMKRGETDAGELNREFGEEQDVKITAWNNRLSSLSSRGLVIEVSQGRAKRYKRLIKEVSAWE